MFINPKYKLFTGLIGLLIFAIGLLIELAGTNVIRQVQLNKTANAVSTAVYEKEVATDRLFSMLEDRLPGSITENFSSTMNYCEKHGMALFIFSGNRLIAWTNNSVMPDQVTAFRYSESLAVSIKNNGLYLRAEKNIGPYRGIVLIPVKKDYQIENQYLKNEFVLYPRTDNYFNLLVNGNEDSDFRIYNSEGQYLFTLSPITAKGQFWVGSILLLTGFLLMFFAVHLTIAAQLKKKGTLTGLGLIVLMTGLTYLFWKVLQFPPLLFNTDLFSSSYYASSPFLASLGDVLILTLLVNWVNYFICNYLTIKIPDLKALRFVIVGLMFTAMLGLAIFIDHLFKGLVINSSISFDLGDLHSLNLMSLLGFLIVAIWLLVYVLLYFRIFRLVRQHFKNLKSRIPVLLPAIILAIIFIYSAYDHAYEVLLLPFLLWLCFATFIRERQKSNQYITYVLITVLACSVFATLRLLEFNREKEMDNQKLLASRLVSEGDAVAEYLFADIYQKIKDDRFVRNFFQNPVLVKPYLSRRVEELYFTGYFSKYDMELYTFSQDGSPYKGNYDINLSYFEQMTDDRLQAVLGDYLYFIENATGVPSYLSIIEVEHKGKKLGTLVIRISQKIYFEESVYPELLVGQRERETELYKGEISYAVYSGQKLATQKGPYSYPFNLEFEARPDESYAFVKEKDYTHMLHQLNPDTFIVLTSANKSRFYPVAVFSTLFLIFILITILIIGLRSIHFNRVLRLKGLMHQVNPKNVDIFKNMSFRSRVQFSIVLSVLIAMVLIGYATTTYMVIDFNEREKEELRQKTRLVLDRLNNKTLESPGILSGNNELLNVSINNLSDLFRTDINLYNSNGEIIASSQMTIFESDIISHKMSPSAYYRMGILKQSHMISTEKIGELSYLSSYLPIRSAEGELLAFLQLPYFAKEAELEHQIGALLSTLLNIYVFLFLLVSILSVPVTRALTRPFGLITEKLRKTTLGRRNEPIEWKSNDEIGRLIKEYNFMLKELEKSADMLAKSEREGAWREMAKQVAHEIKNPLTPMKLNIQHLQRAWDEGHEDLDENFKKVTDLLIRQIESLSQIATEFSAFAQMPAGIPENVEVDKVLHSICELYYHQKNVEIKLEVPEESLLVYIDKGQLGRVFNNLLKNAIQAIPDDKQGEIRVKLEKENNHALIQVTDNGKGISDDLKDKVFVPNFSTKSSGMGMGLAISLKSIEQAGGKIWFESESNQGTSVFVRLPLV